MARLGGQTKRISVACINGYVVFFVSIFIHPKSQGLLYRQQGIFSRGFSAKGQLRSPGPQKAIQLFGERRSNGADELLPFYGKTNSAEFPTTKCQVPPVMTEGESELTQLKNNYSRKERQITLSRQSIRWNQFNLCRSKTALFSLLWGKKCGFCAKPRKKQLRNRRIYAIV